MTKQEVIDDQIRTLEGETIPPLVEEMEEAYASYAKARATFYEQGKKKAFSMAYRAATSKDNLYYELLDKGGDWFAKHQNIKKLKDEMEDLEHKAKNAITAVEKLEHERDKLQNESAKLDGSNARIKSTNSYYAQFKSQLEMNAGFLKGGRKNRRRKSRRKSRRRKSRRKKKRTRKRRRRRRRK